METYQVNFSSWADVQKEYSMQEPEPDQVYLAYYSYEDYSGTSKVIFRRGDKFYINDGGHCSCYGLEDQWQPEVFESKDLFVKYLENLKPYDCSEQILEVIQQLKV